LCTSLKDSFISVFVKRQHDFRLFEIMFIIRFLQGLFKLQEGEVVGNGTV